jgi:hypothetical protein
MQDFQNDFRPGYLGKLCYCLHSPLACDFGSTVTRIKQAAKAQLSSSSLNISYHDGNAHETSYLQSLQMFLGLSLKHVFASTLMA